MTKTFSFEKLPILVKFYVLLAFTLFSYKASAQLDVGISAVGSPSHGCPNDTVKYLLYNYAGTTIDLAINPVTIVAYTTGINPQSFSNTVVNSGTIASGASISVIVSSNYNMSTIGTYTFRGYTQLGGDVNNANDSLPSTNYVVNGPPTTVGDTICGEGTVILSASGGTLYKWYTQASGGSPINSGPTYSPYLYSSATYYVSQGGIEDIHTTTYAAGNGSAGNCFTIKALNSLTISGFDGHTSTSSGTNNWEIWYRPNNFLLTPGSHLSSTGWTQLGTALGVPNMGPGNVNPIPIALNLIIPAGETYSFQIFCGGNVSYTNGTSLGAIYDSNSDLEVYQGYGGTGFGGMVNQPRIFNGRIHYATGCQSGRTSVLALVNTAPAMTITASSSTSCSADPVTLDAISANMNYAYSWTPSTGLNNTTSASVIATPSATTTYIVTATDTGTGCVSKDTVQVLAVLKPSVIASTTDDSVCLGNSITLSTTVAPSIYQIGTGTIQNTTTSYPAPYGNYYYGARHQMLILASELQSVYAGPGNISALAFDVVNINSGTALTDFEIKLAATSATSISTFLTPTFTSVFQSPSYSPSFGIVPHLFSTPFYWDGVSNLLVETCFNNGSYVDNVTFNQSATSFNSTVYFRQDAAGVCVNPVVTGVVSQRPNMYLYIENDYGYDWTPSTFLATPTSASTLATPTTSTDFMVTVLDSITGCMGRDTVSVVVEAFDGGSDKSTCVTVPIMLSPMGAGAWAGGAGSFNGNEYTPNMSEAGTTVTLTWTIGTGACAPDTDYVNVTVLAVPSQPTIMASNNTPCASTQITLTATPAIGFTAVEYLWFKNGVPINSGLTNTYTVNVGSNAVSINYSVEIVYSGYNCLSQNSASTTVTVSAPTATITPSGPTTFCGNTPTTLNATAGMSNYVWKRSTTTVQSGGSASYIPTVSGNYNVTVTINGCSKTSTWTNIIVKAVPTANAGADQNVCLGSAIQIGAASGAGNTYTWTPTASLSNAYVSNPMASPATTTAYTVTVNNGTTGCSNTDAVNVNVLGLPSTPTISSAPSGNLIIISSNTPGASTINWYKNGLGLYVNKLPNSSISVYPSNPTAAYTVKSKGANGCLSNPSGAVNVRIGDEKGGDLLVGEMLMQAYPNPVSDILNVDIVNSEIANGKLVLYNNLGQVIWQAEISLPTGMASTQIDMSPLAAGVYSLVFQTGSGNYIQKVIKE